MSALQIKKGSSKHSAYNLRPTFSASDGNDLKALYEQQWLPKLTEFEPELLFISAGFDAHLEDDMASFASTHLLK